MSHINVRSLAVTCLDLIEQMLTLDRSFDIISANETKLDIIIANFKVNIKDCSLYRKYRNRQGGGVAIYVSQNTQSLSNADLHIGRRFFLFVALKSSVSYPTKIFSPVYHTPSPTFPDPARSRGQNVIVK